MATDPQSPTEEEQQTSDANQKEVDPKKNKPTDKPKGNGGDPGVHFIIDFTHYALPTRIVKVQVRVHLDIPTAKERKHSQHVTWYTMDAKTANPDERELDLSQPVEFLIPFVDINWEKEKHYTMDIAYTLEIEFNAPGNDQAEHKLIKDKGVIQASAGQNYRGPFVYQCKDALPAGMPMEHEAEPLAASNTKGLMDFAGSLAADDYISSDYAKYATDIGTALSSLVAAGANLPEEEPEQKSRGLFGSVSDAASSGFNAASGAVSSLLDSDPEKAVNDLTASVEYLQENIKNGTDPRKGGFDLDQNLDQIADKAIGLATDSLQLKQIIYTQDGVWWHMYYLNNGPTATYLENTQTGAYSSLYSCPSSLGNHRVEDYEACYLPYPRIKGQSPNPADHELRVSYFIKDFRFTPPGNMTPYTGSFSIEGTHEPKKS